jgi:hypothetical protein
MAKTFDPARLEIEHRFGNPAVPREPVDRIKNGTITGYVYDPKTAALHTLIWT